MPPKRVRSPGQSLPTGSAGDHPDANVDSPPLSPKTSKCHSKCHHKVAREQLPGPELTLAPDPGQSLLTDDPHSKRTSRRRRGSAREQLSGPKLTRALNEAIDSKPSAELAVLHLIDQYKFDLKDIENRLYDKGLDVSFSNVTYKAIAPRVALDPSRQLRDMATFELPRARIPTSLFRQTIEDMHLALNQYGPPLEHRTEEARSRFLAPLMNRMISGFKLLIQNTPESIMPGRLTTKGRVEYQFKVCGALTILFVEVKLKIGSNEERLNAVAQVIAEADACDFLNMELNLKSTIYAVLCDGDSFDFFTFQGSTRPPTISRGAFLHNNGEKYLGLDIPNYERTPNPEFIKALRPICETLYAIFLRGYISGLQSYLQCSLDKAASQGKTRDSTPAWVRSISTAEQALELGISGVDMARKGLMKEANEIAAQSWEALNTSVDSAPPEYRRDDCNLIAAWDDSF